MWTRPRILNVDDDEIGRFAVTHMLRSAGFEVDEAVNGTEALRKAESLPDIILLDVRMPDLDGFEVCRRIKADPKLAGITVVHLSATQVDPQARAHGLDWGADGYLTEPVTQGELVATLRAFLRIRRAESAQRFLAEASRELASVVGGVDPVLLRLTQLAASFFGDFCCIAKLDARGQLQHLAAVRGDAPAALPVGLFGRGAAPAILQVAHSGQPLTGVMADQLQLEGTLGMPDGSALADLLPCSFLSVPLRARTRNLGVITVGARAGERSYTPRELALLEDLAARSAVLVDNARLYEQAQSAIATREHLLAVVSHDLKDPLNSVVMGCEMLRASATEPNSRRWLEIMQRSARRMDRLIHDLLDLASVEAGTLSIERKPCEIAKLIESVFETFQALAAEKSLALTRVLELPATEVSCDRERLHQVLSNLLSNAIKFTPEGGRVELTVKPHQAGVRFSIRDSGPGIPADQLPYVFDRYWQASRTRHLGTGLGLSIAKGIVEAHGGLIRAHAAPGQGSTFEFDLPAGD